MFCKVINDILVVDITTKEVSYGYTLENFAHELKWNGLASDSLAEMIVKEYRKVVLQKFFY